MKNATFTQATNSLRSIQSRVSSVGYQKDIAPCVDVTNPKYGFCEKVFAAGQAVGIDWVTCFDKLPQKQTKRLIQTVAALSSGLTANLDYTYTRIMVALGIAGDKGLCRDALIVMSAGARSGDVNTRGINLGRIDKLMSAHHGISTTPTKTSGCLGRPNGVYTLLGVTTEQKKSTNTCEVLNQDHPFAVWYLKVLSSASDAQLKAMGEKKGVK